MLFKFSKQFSDKEDVQRYADECKPVIVGKDDTWRMNAGSKITTGVFL